MLIDAFGRKIDYLRISLTPECNFRCLYCMPKIPFNHKQNENLLSFSELFDFVKIAIDQGIKKIRITGGEPLLRENLDDFIRMIFEYDQTIDLALSTNGFLLEGMAKSLFEAGLKRVNISLDTLNPRTAKMIAQKEVLSQVLNGIQKAIETGFKVKFNTVVLKGLNDHELLELLEFAKNLNIQIRFIEFMENFHAYGKLQGVQKHEILQILSQKYAIKFLHKALNSPVSLYRIDDYEFGIIDPHSDEFCQTCNRIRLNAQGLLIPCLYFDEGRSIKNALQQKDLKRACEILKEVLENKPEKNRWSTKKSEFSSRAFYQTGG